MDDLTCCTQYVVSLCWLAVSVRCVCSVTPYDSLLRVGLLYDLYAGVAQLVAVVFEVDVDD